MQNTKKNTCYQCTDRKVTAEYNCHSHCERYLSFINERKRIDKERHKNDEYRDYIEHTKRKRVYGYS